MKTTLSHRFFVAKALALAAALVWAAQLRAESTPPDIAYLLNHVATAADCQFIRNGDAHTPAEALTHITRKYKHYARRIDSAERFIELAATRSTLTRKPYWVACSGQPKQRTADWLTAALAHYRHGLASSD